MKKPSTIMVDGFFLVKQSLNKTWFKYLIVKNKI